VLVESVADRAKSGELGLVPHRFAARVRINSSVVRHCDPSGIEPSGRALMESRIPIALAVIGLDSAQAWAARQALMKKRSSTYLFPFERLR
jgi:hypothetical protein